VNASLCVTLLMLQSANRETKDSLRLFKDRGEVHGFFPDEGDPEAQGTLLEETPNLVAYAVSATSRSFWPMVKLRPAHSLNHPRRSVTSEAPATLLPP
jgi:hypothetical protein